MRLNRNQRYRRPAAKPFVESFGRASGPEMFGRDSPARKLPPGALSVEEKDNYGEN